MKNYETTVRVDGDHGFATGYDEQGKFSFVGKVIREMADPVDYIIKPFMKRINDPSYLVNDLNVMKLITADTGVGKTHTMLNKLIPTLFEKFPIDIGIITAPQKVIIDNEAVEDMVADMLGVVFCTHPIEAINAMKRGRRVVLAATHGANFVHHGETLFNYIKSQNKLATIWVDEAHMWTVSSKETNPYVAGNDPRNYKATVYKYVSRFAELTPHVFGLTATPNREHWDQVKPVGKMRFDLMNEKAPKELTMHITAWIRSTGMYNIESRSETEQAFFGALDKNRFCYEKTENKRTMMIVCSRESSSDYYVEDVINLINQYQKSLGNESEKSIVVMTNDNNQLCSPDGKYVEKIRGGDHEALKLLRDNSHSAQYLLIVEKGKAGMNVHNMKDMFSFRKAYKKTLDHVHVFENHLQQIGRVGRTNAGISYDEFSKNYGYDLRKYIATLDEEGKNKLLYDNSMNITVPNAENWRLALDHVKSDTYSSVEVAKKWIESLGANEKSVEFENLQRFFDIDDIIEDSLNTLSRYLPGIKV